MYHSELVSESQNNALQLFKNLMKV